MNTFENIFPKRIFSRMLILFLAAVLVFFTACRDSNHPSVSGALYTCPMPRDSFFSDHPGRCPKCGMELVKVEKAVQQQPSSGDTNARLPVAGYTCPMHPQVHSDTDGNCPICGMKLEPEKPATDARSVPLEALLQPANRRVVADVPMVHLMPREENIEIRTSGFITYDPATRGSIAANVSGRVEKMYVRFRFQQIRKGQKLLELYSPEMVTAQENLLYLLNHDPGNQTLIAAARDKLLLLGMGAGQLQQVINRKQVSMTVTIYSAYSGHIHETVPMSSGQDALDPELSPSTLRTRELRLKEGMYVKREEQLFSVYDPTRAWAVMNVFADQASAVKAGDRMKLVAETNPHDSIEVRVSYIEPFYRPGSKTLTVRAPFNNSRLQIPIGSQASAVIYAGNKNAFWLPEEAVLSKGLEKVVFVRQGESFVARQIQTGMTNKHLVQVLGGLQQNEAVAANAQYLMDSESLIKTKEQ